MMEFPLNVPVLIGSRPSPSDQDDEIGPIGGGVMQNDPHGTPVEIDHLDPVWRRRGWHPVNPKSVNDIDPKLRTAFVSFATTWADIVIPIHLLHDNLGRLGAMTERFVQKRGKFRYLLLKVSLRLLNFQIKRINGLFGEELLFGLSLFDGIELPQSVRIFSKSGKPGRDFSEHVASPDQTESPDPITPLKGDH